MKDIIKKDKQYTWHPFTQTKGALPHIPIVKGEKAYLYDDDDNQYLDAVSSWWVTIHGHSNEHIAKAVYEQFLTLEHVIFAGFTHPKAVEIAERLLSYLPDNQSKCFFSDNGSTANEVALKMAIQYWYNKGENKRKVIAFSDAYHGDTFGAMSVSGRSVFNAAFNEHMFDVLHLDVPVKGKEKAVLEQMREYVETEDVAAFIFEPLILGSGGMLMYEPEILDQLIEICNQNNVLCIADEVMVGFGRTGRFFASDYLKNKPDIFALSKGLTGGVMPLGITSCTESIYEAFINEKEGERFHHVLNWLYKK